MYLVTGSTGWIGKHLVRHLMATTDATVYVWIRPSADTTTEERRRRLAAFAGGNDHRLRLLPYRETFPEELPEDIRVIFHCAAEVNFVGSSDICDSNVGLLWRLLHSAMRLKGLQRFLHISTGSLRTNSPHPFSEMDLDCGQQFLSPYDLTKFLGEVLIKKFYRPLPITVVRPGSVFAARDGSFPHRNDWFYQTIRLWLSQHLDALPLGAEQCLYPIPVDELAERLCSLTTIADLPPLLHIPADLGPNAAEIFKIMAEKLGCAVPKMWSQDCSEWRASYANLKPRVRHAIDALYPPPPPGQKLAPLVSPFSQKWLSEHSIPPVRIPDSYWAMLAVTVAQQENLLPDHRR
jgi:nucleoside-diphosphate-sugar epimerase